MILTGTIVNVAAISAGALGERRPTQRTIQTSSSADRYLFVPGYPAGSNKAASQPP